MNTGNRAEKNGRAVEFNTPTEAGALEVHEPARQLRVSARGPESLQRIENGRRVARAVDALRSIRQPS